MTDRIAVVCNDGKKVILRAGEWILSIAYGDCITMSIGVCETPSRGIVEMWKDGKVVCSMFADYIQKWRY